MGGEGRRGGIDRRSKACKQISRMIKVKAGCVSKRGIDQEETEMTLVTTFAQNSWNFLYINGKGFLAGSLALFFEERAPHPRSFSAPSADSSRICSSILISGKPGVHDLRAFAIVHRRLSRMCERIGMPGWALYQSLYCLPVRRSVVITCRLSTTMKRWSHPAIC